MVTSSMETRQFRKRRWKSSPNKTARAELDFGQTTPSPKRRRTDVNLRTHINDEQESFTIKSFYGKREKKHFPHSPGRRKKVDQVLNKLTDDSTESESEKNHKHVDKKSVMTNDKRSDYHFHSSDSADTDSEFKLKVNANNRSAEKLALKKVPLDIRVKKLEPKTPKMNIANRKFTSKSTSKLPDRPVLAEKQLQTPVSGKKFFKTRSPASADKCFAGIVVRKGFQLQFVANKKAQASKTLKSSKKISKRNAEKPLAKGITVKSLKKNNTPEDGIIYLEDEKETSKEPGAEKSDEGDETVITDHDKDLQNNVSDLISVDTKDPDVLEMGTNLEMFPDKELNDSAIETANSEDLFSNVSDHSGPVIRERPNNDTCSEIESEQLDSGQTTPSRRTPSNSVSPVSEGSSFIKSSQQSPAEKKLFPIFNKGMRTPQDAGRKSLRKLRLSNSPGGSPLLRYVKSKDRKEQMILDAGQKRYGVTQCGICGMVYSQAEPADETMHHKFHQGLLNALRFPGWKKEHVLQEYLDTGSRIIMVKAGDPAYATKKVEEINDIMGRELGFPEQNMVFMPQYKAFLYISSMKRIEGCCITEPITEGYPVIPGSQSHSPSPQKHPGQRPWYCSDKPKKAMVGISKIWVYAQSRKQGIATRLLESVRQWFEYGTVIPKEKVAFSDPTPDGKKLAEKYLESPEFLVYKFQ